MYEALRNIACFVTASVSFVYGARVAWGCGRRGLFCRKSQDKLELLLESIPSAAIILSIGFFIVFDHLIDDLFTWSIVSLTSAVLCSLFIVFAAMPRLKRTAPGNGVVVELANGAICRLTKKTFDAYLSEGRIAKFKRSDGWVDVKKDRLRKQKNQAVYVGVERRIQG